MRNAKKIWLIVAAALVVLGLLTWAVVMSIFGWNFSKLNTAKYETNEYTVTEVFNDISIDTKTANIEFLLSDDDSCRVVCHEMVKAKHSVSVKDGTLKIKFNDERKCRLIDDAKRDIVINKIIRVTYSSKTNAPLVLILTACAIAVKTSIKACENNPKIYFPLTICALEQGIVSLYSSQPLRSSYPRMVTGIIPASIQG